MIWQQKKIRLKPQKRGFHLITSEIEQKLTELNTIKIGIANIFIQHTSASLTINENADPTVRADFESHFNHFVPERQSYYLHDYEGDDDMPAHLKASILSTSLTIPITNGGFNLGTWQGIYLGEHRNSASGRTLLITLQGE